MNNSPLGQYIPGNTIVHRLDPRIKIILVFMYMITLFLINNLVYYIPMFLFVYMTIKIANLSFLNIIKSLKSIIFILVFTTLIHIFSTPGKELVKFIGLTITLEGIERAIYICVRLILLVIGTSYLTLTTSTTKLTDGIESLLSPLKVIKFPAHELAMMISIALRFIPTLFDEANKIRKAQLARGAEFDSGNIMKKAKSMVPLLVPLFINSFRRAKELAIAMESRGYRGSEGRTRLNPLKLRKLDYIVFIIVTIFFTSLVLVGIYL
ncbi:energy-coupling factor transporter transmembrane component T family protein [Helcococcus bovis]|uniref:energy-coupling factor transporter transmembrane component T family protein n=1 Tax=Helcococcus bovis TaxID=3153252 RepID=UPI0038BC348E